MAEPLTIALHGLHRTQLKKGEHIAVIGAGTIGLMAALAALSYGAVPILLDIVPERLELAKKLGSALCDQFSQRFGGGADFEIHRR